MRALALRHVLFEDLGLLAPLLADRGYAVTYADVPVDGTPRDDVLAADLLVVLGGPIGAYETAAYPFLVPETEAIAARVAAGRPTLGICLGAQLIALALGGEVRPTGRKEIGYAPVTLTAAGRATPLALIGDTPVLHWHGDEFLAPYPDLAGTPGFPHQAFAAGPSILGLQFHLEADWRRIEAWLVGHAAELAGAGLDPRAIRQAAQDLGPALEQAGRAVFAAWLDGLS
jgi:GMP synthase (glutamine-hydrolysing)